MPGTVLVKDVNSLSLGSYPGYEANVNGVLYFTAFDIAHGRELWKTDGSSAGTVLVKDIFPGSTGSSPAYLTNVNGTLYFTVRDPVLGRELWKSDGTTAGTVRISNFDSFTTGYGSFIYPGSLTNVNGTLFFSAASTSYGNELWKSNGTIAGTVMVSDIHPGSSYYRTYYGVYAQYASSSSPARLTNVNGTLFFTANDGSHGRELWKSDGTSIGTVLIKDINPSFSESYQFPYGTILLPNGSYANDFVNVNGTLYFSANDGSTGYELWKSDGSDVGTVQIRDILPGPSSSLPSFLTNMNGTLFFSANDGTNGTELWKSNGSSAGTVLVNDIFPGFQYPGGPGLGSYPSAFTNVNGTLFFAANDGTNGTELWKSDGSSAGTVLIKDIRPGQLSSYPYRLTNVNGSLFFTALDGLRGDELWKSNGTNTGTEMFLEVMPGSAGSYPSQLVNMGGTLYFAANDGVHGSELWTSGIKAKTISSLGSTAATAVYGQSVTVKLTVAPLPLGTGTPTGLVTFYDGTTILGTAPLVFDATRYVASFNLPATLATGVHTLRGVYAGDAENVGTSATMTQTIIRANTTIALTANPASSTLGQPVLLKATVGVVAPGAGAPTGTVTFKDGTAVLGTGTLSVSNGSVVATLSTTAIPIGTHSITAEYAGDVNFSSKTSAAINVTVKTPSTTTLGSTASTSRFGQSVILKATITPVAPGSIDPPTGTVTFFDGTTSLGTSTVTFDGTRYLAAFNLPTTLSVGSHTLKAVYSGDTNFGTSTSTNLTQTVVKADTAITVSTNPTSGVFGQSVTLKAIMSVVAPGSGTPTGTVTFKDGTTVLGTGTLSVVSGQVVATLTTNSLPVGNRSITAVYSGSSNYNGKTSAAFSFAVSKAHTATSLGSTSSTAVYGQTVTVKATITVVAPGAGAPTGTVTFFDGTTNLGTGTVTFTGGRYVAAFNLPTTLAVGTHSLQAVYFGDSQFASSISATVTQTINKAASNATLASTSSTAVFGQPVTVKATIAALAPGGGAPTGTVTFFDGTTNLGTGTVLFDGTRYVASFNLPTTLSVRTHSLKAVYAGDAHFTTSTSPVFIQTIVSGFTTTKPTATSTSIPLNEPMTLTTKNGVVPPIAGTPQSRLRSKPKS